MIDDHDANAIPADHRDAADRDDATSHCSGIEPDAPGYGFRPHLEDPE